MRERERRCTPGVGLALLPALWLIAGSPAAAQVSFTELVEFPVGTSPQWTVAGDFDKDGVLDLAVANRGSDSVSVLFGNGDGTFQPTQVVGVGDQPTSIAMDDFDADGQLDLAVTDYGVSTVSLLLGNPDGTFRLPLTVAPLGGTNPNMASSGDFNGDGKRDLAIALFGESSSTVVSVLLGNGNGTFQVPLVLNALRAPLWVTVCDLNGDGRQDLAVADFSADAGFVSVLLGNGDGTFQPAQNVAAGLGAAAVAVADYDRDGHEDMAVANYHADTLAIHRGNGDGTMQPPSTYVVGDAPVALVAEDFDQDGATDLAVANWQGNAGTIVSILAGNGDGTLEAAQSVEAGRGVVGVTQGDFDGDGLPDLAIANMGSDSVSILRNASTPGTSHTLSVGKTGAGGGTVTSSPAGIDCGATCSASYASGTVVTLTAAPASGSTFAGWTGAGCSGTGSCTVTMNAAASVTARFDALAFTLSVGKTGAGGGTVTSNPAGIDCGATCSASYASGTVVTLTAAPASGSTFAGWTGADCSGTGSCTVTMNAAASVTATFNRQTFTLTVTKQGLGLGTVTSSPAGIDCGSSCSASYASGTTITLTASPGLLSAFDGWSGGGCSGTGPCTITLGGHTTVTARFRLLGLF